MSAPELLGDLAAAFLARIWHHQPEGAPMTDPLEAAARADHARHCRDHDPNITDVQIDAYWDAIGELSRDVFRRIAAARVAEEVGEVNPEEQPTTVLRAGSGTPVAVGQRVLFVEADGARHVGVVESVGEDGSFTFAHPTMSPIASQYFASDGGVR